MKKIKRIAAASLCAALLLFSLAACKNVVKSPLGEPQLKIGVSSLGGELDPFYCEKDADREIVSQMFRTVQRRGRDNKLINYSGGISYEFVDGDKVKYTISIRDDMRFSDGENITIDDVIFFYLFIADASYDGPYKDWYLNDIEGLKEYYYDDENYAESLAGIKKTVEEKYTSSTIGEEDYVEYLVATKLEGKFSGLDGPSPRGVSWRAYLDGLGYSEELKTADKSPSFDDGLRLAARAEAENNPSAYDPAEWYGESLYRKYIKKNYADGIDVPNIAGVKKINDYACTAIFNSRNINAVSQLNVPIVSKNYYSVKYVKGSASKIKELEGFPVCSGPYCVVEADSSGVLAAANEYYSDADCEFKTIKFVPLGERGEDMVKNLVSGRVDVIKVLADAGVTGALAGKRFRTVITNCDYYAAAFFNPRSLDSAARKALMGLCSAGPALDKNIGSYYTLLFSPISSRFAEYPDEITEPYYNESAYSAYKIIGDGAIKNVTAYYAGEDSDLEYAFLTDYGKKLAEKGITLTIRLVGEDALEEAVLSGEADIWIENIPDGATCDKYDYFNGSGRYNKTTLNDPEINALTSEIRACVGFADKSRATARLMGLVMERAVECPLYQRQFATIYNTDKISEEFFPEDKNFDGFAHVLPYLKKN